VSRDPGYPADRGRGYQALERAALSVRGTVAKNLPLDQALPGIALFERLDLYRVTAEGKPLPLVSAVADLPRRVEALAMYDDQREELVVALAKATYEDLRDERFLQTGILVDTHLARARFTVAHEIGHAVLHANELVRLGRVPHRVHAMQRGSAAEHPTYLDTEWQADVFASAMLMPARGLAALEQEVGELTADAIQRRFRVSYAAASTRAAIFLARRKELLM